MPRRTWVVPLAAALVLVLDGSAVAAPAINYPAPAAPAPVDAASLDARYQAVRHLVREAQAAARAGGDLDRATLLDSLQERRLLEFDPRGAGRAVEVIGDLAGAARIAVLVPGSHTTLDTFDRRRGPGGAARALAAEITAADPGARVATVAWLGYETPQGIDLAAVTDARARAGAAALRRTVADLRRVNATAPIGLFCHSYGAVVCARAAADLPVADLVLYGSPGAGVPSADQLGTTARVWAGRSGRDWIRFVPPVRLWWVGFGADPADPDFGALGFPAGDGQHGDYHLPGGEALRSLAWIARGAPVGPASGSGRGGVAGGMRHG